MTEVERLTRKYAGRGVVIDSNLLVLFLAGEAERSLISRWKRTSKYTENDFDAIDSIVNFFSDRIHASSAILAEVNNLGNSLSGNDRLAYYESLLKLLMVVHEDHVPSKEVGQMDQFATFGLTDLGILWLALRGHLVVTDDGRLEAYLQRTGVDVIGLAMLRST
jgi:rRNA-processing protein FCF1